MNTDEETLLQVLNLAGNHIMTFMERAADLDVPTYQALSLLYATVRDTVLVNLRDPDTVLDLGDIKMGRQTVAWMNANRNPQRHQIDVDAYPSGDDSSPK